MNKSKLSTEKDSRFKKAVSMIKEIISGSAFKEDPVHSKLVHQNVLSLNPEADEALQIAALAHDIDRAIEERRIKEEDYEDYNKYKHDHALQSAQVISEILRKIGYDHSFIKKVKLLVEQHEIGKEGDDKILKEADSLTFFQYNFPYYQKNNTEEQIKNKIRFMYNRLSDKAKVEIKKIKFPDELNKLFLEAISE